MKCLSVQQMPVPNDGPGGSRM